MEERPFRAALRGKKGRGLQAPENSRQHRNSEITARHRRPAESSVEDVILNGGKAAVRDPT